MRIRGILLAVGTVSFVVVLGAFQPSVRSPQEILNEEQYSVTMRRIDTSLGDVAMNIDATYWDELGDAAFRLTSLFERVQAFWTARQVQAAVDHSGAALAAIVTLGQAAGARSASQANEALSDLRSVCQSCHTEFRERTDDGYRIKPGT